MAKKNGYTAQQVIKAIEDADGYVSKAASILKCSPRTVYNYRDKFPTVAEAWEAIREKRHDYVENALHKLIREGNVTAIIFYLKTQAKDRGYVERQELTGAGGDSLVVKLGWGDNADA
jgi:hypothetical protein